MSELARLEADCLKGVQTYAICVHAGGALVARRLFQLEGGRADVPLRREGDGAHEALQLLLKHIEGKEAAIARKDDLIMKMATGYVGGFAKELERLQTRNEALELRDMTRAEGYEKLLSKQHERELAAKKTEHGMQMTQELVHGVRMLAPFIGNKIIGEKALPTGTLSPKEQALQALLESVTPQQMQQLQTVLNPYQAIAIMEFWQDYVGKKDETPADKAQEKR
ncbi:hypothetical protein QHF83_17830 [Polyangium sp. 15x6]|nr:hypothetical protein [Polyangium sp. 15x6]